jgi:two-component system, LytTR family, response regulator
MIKAVIIDDESRGRATLQNLIGKYCPQVEICGEADGVTSGIELIVKTKPELVFLDVQMGDGSGFDLLENISNPSFRLIFVTAYDQYAIRAFRFSAIDYLLKPVNPDELVNAVKRATGTNPLAEVSKKLDVLLSNRSGLEKIALASTEGIHLMKVRDIVRCESDSNYTTIFLCGGQKIVATKTLKEFDEILTPLNFFRIHQSHLVNLDYIVKYNKTEGGSVVMEDGNELPIARRRKDEFVDFLTQRKT